MEPVVEYRYCVVEQKNRNMTNVALKKSIVSQSPFFYHCDMSLNRVYSKAQ